MQLIFLFGVLSVLFSSAVTHADAPMPLPPEMLLMEKPIDPKCISAAMRDRKGKGVELNNICPEFSGDGFPAEKQTLILRVKGAGYDFEYEGGNSGGFYYDVVGKISEGIVLNINYSTGGSGHFSDLSVYERDGDILRKVRSIAGGDRCTGGIVEAKIEDGHLLYAYNVTSLELYQKYTPNASYRGDLGSGYTNCGAVIRMKDDKTESIELDEGAIIPDCFKEEYTKQIISKKTLSDIEAKDFIEKFSKMCPIE